MKIPNLKGVIPAAILPMTADFEPDYDAFTRYIHWLISQNAVSIAVNMDTGEGPQLNAAEKRRVIEVAVEAAAGEMRHRLGCDGRYHSRRGGSCKELPRGGRGWVGGIPQRGFSK